MSAPNCWWRSRSPTKSRTLLPRQCCTGESSLSSPVNNYWQSCKELYGEWGRLVLSKRQIHAIVFARDSPEPPHPIANNWYTYKPATTMSQDTYSAQFASGMSAASIGPARCLPDAQAVIIFDSR